MKKIKILPLSPWNFSTFLTCPYKFWCQKNPEIKPLPQKDNIYALFGRNLHSLIQAYYKKIMVTHDSVILPDIVNEIINQTIQEQTIKLRIDNINKGYTQHLRNFEEFEKDRIKRNWSIVNVEKRIVDKGLKGFIDAIFKDSNGNIIVVDWKTGKWKEEFLIQGYIYKRLSNADKVMFFHSLNGIEHNLSEKELNRGKEMFIDVITQVKNGVRSRKTNPFCKNCEYSLACGFNDIGIGLEKL